MKSPDVPAVLRSAIQDSGTAHYVGRREVEFRRDGKVFHHDEIVYRDGPNTRVEFPEGSRYSGQVIVETRQERRHFLPDKNELRILPPRREETFDRMVSLAHRAIDKKISLSVQSGDRVAGCNTTQLVVTDAQGNVIQRLYFDTKHNVMLKRELFGPGGAQFGHFAFKEIDFSSKPFPADIFLFNRRGVKIMRPTDILHEVASREHFDPVYLPPTTGFRLDESEVHNIQSEPVLVESYWSKRGKLTLFELKTNVSDEKLHNFEHGDLHAVTWRLNGFSYVLVGSVDIQTLGRLSMEAHSGTSP